MVCGVGCWWGFLDATSLLERVPKRGLSKLTCPVMYGPQIWSPIVVEVCSAPLESAPSARAPFPPHPLPSVPCHGPFPTSAPLHIPPLGSMAYIPIPQEMQSCYVRAEHIHAPHTHATSHLVLRTAPDTSTPSAESPLPLPYTEPMCALVCVVVCAADEPPPPPPPLALPIMQHAPPLSEQPPAMQCPAVPYPYPSF